MADKALFLGSNFRNLFLMELRVLKPSDPKNQVFSGKSMCVCARESVISTTQKQNTAGN